jgi:hypothetical protein
MRFFRAGWPRLGALVLSLACLAGSGVRAGAATLDHLNGVRIQAIVTGTQRFVVKGKPVDVAITGSGLIRVAGKRVQGSVTRTYRYGSQSGPELTNSISGNIVDSAPPKGRAWVFDGTTLTFHDVVEAMHLAAVYRVTLTGDGKGCSVRVTSAVVPGQTVMTPLLGFAGVPNAQLLSSTMASSECKVMR